MGEALAQGVQHMGREAELWSIIQGIMGVLLFIIGILVKVVWTRQNELLQKWEDMRISLAENYVRDTEFKEAIIDFKKELHTSLIPLCDRVTKIDEFLRHRRDP